MLRSVAVTYYLIKALLGLNSGDDPLVGKRVNKFRSERIE